MVAYHAIDSEDEILAKSEAVAFRNAKVEHLLAKPLLALGRD
jgi:hypothetical protein